MREWGWDLTGYEGRMHTRDKSLVKGAESCKKYSKRACISFKLGSGKKKEKFGKHFDCEGISKISWRGKRVAGPALPFWLMR